MPKPKPIKKRLPISIIGEFEMAINHKLPINVRANPIIIKRTAPKRASQNPAKGEANTEPIGIGKITKAAFSGVKPATNCKRWLSRNSIPTMITIERVDIATPTLK